MSRANALPDGQRGFGIRENNRRYTRVFFTEHGDLIIQQQMSGHAPVTVSSYSDAGIRMYAFLLKFLSNRGMKPPRVLKTGRGSDYRESAKDEGRLMAQIPFPARFFNEHRQAMDEARVEQVNSITVLELTSGEQKIQLTPMVVGTILENLPKYAPDTGPYRILRAMLGRRRMREILPRKRPSPPSTTAERRTRSRKPKRA